MPCTVLCFECIFINNYQGNFKSTSTKCKALSRFFIFVFESLHWRDLSQLKDPSTHHMQIFIPSFESKSFLCFTFVPKGFPLILGLHLGCLTTLSLQPSNLGMPLGSSLPIYLWRKVVCFCSYEIHWTRMLQIVFLVSLESSWQGGVHGIGSMTFGLAVQKFLNIEWFLHWKLN